MIKPATLRETARRLAVVFVALVLLVGFALPVRAQSQAVAGGEAPVKRATADAITVREAEIRHCRPGDIAVWGDGRDGPAPTRQLLFTYNPEHAPAFLPRETVEPLVRTALAAWAPCGLQLDWTEWMPRLERLDDVRIIGWMPPSDDAGALIGGADFAHRRLLLSPKVFTLLKDRNPAHLQSTLQMTLAHEIGHFLGLVAHSRRCVDVTSYYNDTQGRPCLTGNSAGVHSIKGLVEYRSVLPTACDIARCRRANNLPPLLDSAP
jgi:hypothetical protein